MSDIHALSGAYAVDALDDIERAQFERHLAGCAACRAEVESLQEAAALLAETTTATPSAELRDRVLSGISNVRPLPPVMEKNEPGDATVTGLAPRRRRRVVALLAAAAAAVAIGTGGIVWQQVSDDGSPDRIEAIADAPDARSYTVPVGDGGSATVTVSKQRNGAYIATKDMPGAPSGKQYVLWLQHGSTMTPAGVMPEGSDNEVLLSGDAATADGAAVSIENADTEPTVPSDDVVAVFSFDT
jgi:anti-sigma-K factor RskA